MELHLDDFTVLKKPLNASKMKELTKQGFPFRTTMSDGWRMAV